MKCKVFVQGELFLEEANIDFLDSSVVNIYTDGAKNNLYIHSCDIRILGKEIKIEGYKRNEGSETYGNNTNYSRLIISCLIIQ